MLQGGVLRTHCIRGKIETKSDDSTLLG